MRWTVAALLGLPISFILWMSPLGIGFSPVWSQPGAMVSLLRMLALAAVAFPLIFWLGMFVAWPLYWWLKRRWVMATPFWLSVAQLSLLCAVVVSF